MEEDQYDVESPLELLQDLLVDSTASDFTESTVNSTVEKIITSTDNDMETKPTDHPMTDSWLVNDHSVMMTTDSVVHNVALTELVDTVVDTAIKNAVIQLIEQSTTAYVNICSPSSSDERNGEKEKSITEAKIVDENKSTNNDCHKPIEEYKVITETIEIYKSSEGDKAIPDTPPQGGDTKYGELLEPCTATQNITDATDVAMMN